VSPLVWIAIPLAVVVFSVWLARQGRFAWRAPAQRLRSETRDGSVETVSFSSSGAQIEAWLFLPHAPTDAVVIMAPGLTGTKEGLLEPFAWEFVRRGAAALLFDFRHLGGSEGLPRHWIDPFRQIEDYEAAIAYAAPRFGRVIVWGSSFSGGEVLCLAARRTHAIAAVIAHAPFVATSPAVEPKGLRLLRFIVLAVLDLALAKLSAGRLPPVYIPAFGKPGEFAFGPSEECPARDGTGLDRAEAFWRELPPPRAPWRNVLCARLLPEMERFVPLDHVQEIPCPVLFVAASRDSLNPQAQLEAAAHRAPGGRLHVLESSHFGLYTAPVLAQNLAIQGAFVEEVLASTAQAEHGDSEAGRIQSGSH